MTSMEGHDADVPEWETSTRRVALPRNDGMFSHNRAACIIVSFYLAQEYVLFLYDLDVVTAIPTQTYA